MTMNGALPPSSSEIGVRCTVAASMIRRPVGTLPVMVMRSTPGAPVSRSPTVLPPPVTMLTTPGGTPASLNSRPMNSAESGVSSCGLRTMVSPAIIAGATFRETSAAG